MNNTNSSTFDLSVFKKWANHNENHNDCGLIQRLLAGLKYYFLLDIVHKKDNRDIFNHFIHRVYSTQNILNDFDHLIDEHGDDLYEINKSMIKTKKFSECNINKCKLSARHFRKESVDSNDNDKMDGLLSFHKDTFDGLHFYLFHLFEAGLRFNEENEDPDDDEQQNEDEEKAKSPHFDKAISKMTRAINRRRQIMSSFNRSEIDNNNKYEIKVVQNEKNITKNHHDGNTGFDALYQHLIHSNIDIERINELFEFLKTEEYDTDALVDDFADDDGANISNELNDKSITQEVSKFVYRSKVEGSSFGLGLRFYYWPFYKDIDELPKQGILNFIDHNGYKVCDLYVTQKYENFKQEILNYQYLDSQLYEEEVITKAKKHINTNRARRTLADPYVTLHYEIKKRTPLSLNHLVAIILYCDYSKLCTDFSSSFRKLSAYESLQSVKSRNREYFWFSRYLREAVEIYGEKCADVYGDNHFGANVHGDNHFGANVYGDNHFGANVYGDRHFGAEVHGGGQAKGPYYTGMSIVLSIPEIQIRLNCPVSTSKKMEIAVNFSGETGMILQINNRDQDNHLRLFNCSWISRFREEDERLFCGGWYRIQIESVILRKTHQNFQNVFGALFDFDEFLTGKCPKKYNYEHSMIIASLIDYKLGHGAFANRKFDKYVYQTFEAFCHAKIEISLWLGRMYQSGNSEMMRYFMNRLVSMKDGGTNIRNSTNLPRLYISQIFPNVETVHIHTAYGDHNHMINLWSLLSLISETKWNKIIVKDGTHFKQYKWLNAEWMKSGTRLKEAYKEKGFEINVIEKYYWDGDAAIITRI